MEKFTNEEIGRLYGNTVQLQAMIYFLGVGDWEKEPDAVKSSIQTILADCNSILNIVMPKAEELMPEPEKADEQEKTD